MSLVADQQRRWLSVAIRGCSMRQVNPYLFYMLGRALGELDEDLRNPSDGTIFALFYAQRTLDLFIKDQIHLPLSKDAARMIVSQIAPIVHQASHRKDSTTVLPQADEIRPIAAGIKASIATFDTVFSAETRRLNLYAVTQKRLYNMDLLVAEGDSGLSDEARTVLEFLEVTEDLKDAGRCLAFDQSTASAFHVFRVIEAVVTAYFPALNMAPPIPSQRNLGNYAKILREAGVSEKVTGVVDHLREHYRNPITHPDVRLDDNEAQSLFGFAQSVIEMMITDLDDIKKGKYSPTPPDPEKAVV